jgi:transcription elongation factor GreA
MKAEILKKFEKEIKVLNRELKLDLPREIQRAREHGDLRENAEYQAAKERQRLVEAQISLLQKRVSEIALMDLDNLPLNKASFGSVLRVKENDNEVIEYHLVMAEDADGAKGRISVASPIGRGLMGKSEGDIVEVSTPGGVREFKIIELKTIHNE